MIESSFQGGNAAPGRCGCAGEPQAPPAPGDPLRRDCGESLPEGTDISAGDGRIQLAVELRACQDTTPGHHARAGMARSSGLCRGRMATHWHGKRSSARCCFSCLRIWHSTNRRARAASLSPAPAPLQHFGGFCPVTHITPISKAMLDGAGMCRAAARHEAGALYGSSTSRPLDAASSKQTGQCRGSRNYIGY